MIHEIRVEIIRKVTEKGRRVEEKTVEVEVQAMANIVRWDPYHEMARMNRLMDRWFEDMPHMWRGEFDGESYFPLDLYETDEAIVAKATLPGVKPEDVEITITGETLTIRGETKREEEEKKRNYYRQESWHGSFAAR